MGAAYPDIVRERELDREVGPRRGGGLRAHARAGPRRCWRSACARRRWTSARRLPAPRHLRLPVRDDARDRRRARRDRLRGGLRACSWRSSGRGRRPARARAARSPAATSSGRSGRRRSSPATSTWRSTPPSAAWSGATGARSSSSPRPRSTRRAAGRSPTRARSPASTATARRRSPTSCAPATTRPSWSSCARRASSEGERVIARVDRAARHATAANHTATHLLHAALRRALGDHVRQAGSYVGPDKLRFDFTHTARLDDKQRAEVEDQVNAWILANHPVRAITTTLDEAQGLGAMALFGEKYGDVVRMVEVGDGDFSRELCGGTHVRSTAEIGLLKILSEGSSASNVRRIEAITGPAAVALLRREDALLREAADALRTPPEGVVEAIGALQGRGEGGGRAPAPRATAAWTPRRWPGAPRRSPARQVLTEVVEGVGRQGRCPTSPTASRAGSATTARSCSAAPSTARSRSWPQSRPAWSRAASRPAPSSRSRRRSRAAAAAAATRWPRPAAATPRSCPRRSPRRGRRSSPPWPELRCADLGARLRLRPLRLRAQRPDRHAGHPDRPRPAARRPARASRSSSGSCASTGSSGWSSACPSALRGDDTDQTREARAFADRLRDGLRGVPVDLYDERFTTAIAARAGRRALVGGLARGRRAAGGLPRPPRPRGARVSPLFGRGGAAARRRASAHRSAEERERARLEREARRARREGRPVPEVPRRRPDRRADRRPGARPAPALPGARARRRSPPPSPSPPEPAGRSDPLPEPEPAPAAAPPPRRAATPEPAVRARARRAAGPEPEPDRREPAPTVRVIGERRRARWAPGASPRRRWPAPRAPRARRASARRPRAAAAGRAARAAVAARRARRSSRCSRSPGSPTRSGSRSRTTPRRGAGARHDPRRRRAPATSASCWRARAIVDSGFFFQLRARLTGDGGKLRSGSVHAAQGHDLRRGAEGADAKGAGAAPTTDGHGARGPLDRRGGRRCCAGRPQGRLRPRHRAARGSSTRATTARRRARTLAARASCGPATYQLKRRATRRRRSSPTSSRPSRRTSPGRPAPRPRPRTSAATTSLIIASMIEREAEVPRDRRAHRLGDLQPAASATSRSGIDATLRYRLGNWTTAAEESPSSHAQRLQHARATRACRRRRSATRAWPRCRPRPTRPTRPTCTTWSSRAATARTPSRAPTRSSSATSPPTTASARSSAARTRRTAEAVRDAPPRRPRLAGRAHALAGHAERGAGRARPARLDATSACRVPPELFAETVRALPGAGLRRAPTSRSRTSDAALALADEASPRRPRDRRGEHAELRATARSAPRTPTRPACSPRCPGRPRAARRSCSGPAAAPAPRPGRCARPGADVAVLNRTAERARTRSPRTSASAPWTPRGPPTCSCNCTSVGLDDRDVQGSARRRRASSRDPRAWSTWSTGTAATPRSSPRHAVRGARSSTGWRSWSTRAR